MSRFVRSFGTKAYPRKVNTLIVGSGPNGSIFARKLIEDAPEKTIFWCEAGGTLSDPPGKNVKNQYVYNWSEDGLDACSQVVKGKEIVISKLKGAPYPHNLDPICQPDPEILEKEAEAGLNGTNPEQVDSRNWPAAFNTYQVGGMFGHWTNCTPRPYASERNPFIPSNELDSLFDEAEKILGTNHDSFTTSLRGQVVKKTVSQFLDNRLPLGRKTGWLPLACKRSGDWVEWTGADTILNPIRNKSGDFLNKNITFVADTLCQKLILKSDGEVAAAVLKNLETGEQQIVEADTFVIAANSFCTPQILWNSGIRPKALGRYLAEHTMVFAQAVLSRDKVKEVVELAKQKGIPVGPGGLPLNDPIPQVWIPFSEEHPFHVQIHRDTFPYSLIDDTFGIDRRLIIEIRYFVPQEQVPENRVKFSEKFKDFHGMPQITFDATMTAKDKKLACLAGEELGEIVAQIGGFFPGRETAFLLPGSSAHYQGTFRIGKDPDTSVVNTDSQVHGIKNLYLAGNGTINVPTACNSSLTSITHSIKAVNSIIRGSKA